MYICGGIECKNLKKMKKPGIIILFFALLLSSGVGYACTSAIVGTQKSSEGVPLLWKHRDSSTWNCCVSYVEGGKYAYTALVSLDGRKTYCGINEKGFAVLNTVSHNLVKTGSSGKKYSAITLMDDILAECATVDEFEAWLAKSNGERGYVTNYAVGDPSGKAAYFEVWNESYKRYDVTERKEGYDIRSNYSFSGDLTKPTESAQRYDIIADQMRGGECFTPQQFIEYSRNYRNTEGGSILDEPNRVVKDDTSVARYTSSASAVMVCDAENPRMLVSAGHPSATMAVPVYVRAKSRLPECLTSRAMLNLGNDFRTKCYEKISKREHSLDKPLIAKVIKINTLCEMPKQLPSDMIKFNAKIDKLFAKHNKKVRKILK